MLTRLIAGTFALIALAVITLCVLYGDVILAGLYWLAVGAGLFLVGAAGITLWVGIERAMTEREKRKGASYQRKQQKYVPFKDGFGMLHLLNLDTDTVENLSTYPGSHHNGHWEDPPPAAAAAWFALVGKARADSPVALLPAAIQEKTIELLPLLDRAERVLVKGASDAGKTTLFQHEATRSQNVIIVDPHFKPGLWPESARIVGAGRNFGEITAFLDWLIQELDVRYKQRAAGTEGWTHYTILIDEFMSINEGCDNAGKVLSAMIRESRKVGFRLFIGSHSELVKPLGLEGASDVKEGLLVVRLEYDQLTGQREATVDYGRGKRPCQFPPFYGPQAAGGEVLLPDFVSQLSGQEQQVSEMLATGESRSAIARRLFGNAGGNQLAKVDEIIKRIS
jgi:hypothetical protein